MLLPSGAKPLYQNFSTQFPYNAAFFVGFKVFALHNEAQKPVRAEPPVVDRVFSAL